MVTAKPDDAVDLDISTPGQRASATIDLVAGDRVYTETIENIDGDLILTGPGGTELTSAFSFAELASKFASRDAGLVVATAAGIYTVIVEPEDAAIGTQVLLIRRP